VIGTELDLEFTIQPGRALLLLEAESLLTSTPSEDSPLRRINSPAEVKIVWDIRKLETLSNPHHKQEHVLFVARKTARYNTHDVVARLLNEGHFVIAEEQELHNSAAGDHESAQQWVKDLDSHPNLILVNSTEKARELLVRSTSSVRSSDWTTLAITGTNGKTSTTQITAALLEQLSQKNVLRLGTLGIQLGDQAWDNPFPTMPDYPGLIAALRMAQQHYSCQQLVMEATSIGIHERRLGSWPVQCAAFLNLSQDHLDYHVTMQNYLEAKLDLFRIYLHPAGQVAVNCNDKHWPEVIEAARGKSRFCVGFGYASQRDEFFESSRSRFSGTRFLEVSHHRSTTQGITGQWTLWLDKQTSVAQCQYHVRLLGDVQHENLAAAAAMMLALGYPLNQIASNAQAIRAIPGRLELVEVAAPDSSPCVLVDYAHSPDALEKTLQTCRSLVPTGGQLICVFGCGGDRDPGKRPQMGRIAAKLSDKVWVTSDNPRTEDPKKILQDILAGVDPQGNTHVVLQIDRRQAICEAIKVASSKDIVLIAGKGHEDYQIIGTTKYPFSDSDVARQALINPRTI